MTVTEQDLQNDEGEQNDSAGPSKKQCISNLSGLPSGYYPKGKLSLLLKMPLDVLTEVFSWLQPLDLLRISRTSNHLRSFLMSKSSQGIWKTSRGNVPVYRRRKFPELPPDLSEPAYASLAFEKWCLTCMKRAVQFDFSCRERVCRVCIKKKGRSRGKGLAEFIEVCKIHGGFRNDIPVIYSLVPLSSIGEQFSIPVAMQIYHQCMLRKSKLSHAAYWEYLTERKAVMDTLREQRHGVYLDTWDVYRVKEERKERGTDEEQREAAQEIKDQRVRDITAKCLDLGWLPEDIPSTHSANHATWEKITCQAKPLTDERWASIKHSLVPLLTAERNLRVGKGKLVAMEGTT